MRNATARQKTQFWGYAQNDRDVRDVVEEDLWNEEERWAIDEALGYAHVTERPPYPAFAHRSFMEKFEAMLDNLLHEPLTICTATKTVQNSHQQTLQEVESA